MAKQYESIENLLERSGYLRCQIQVTDLIRLKEKDLYDTIKRVRFEIMNSDSLLKKQDLINELAGLMGEARALRELWEKILSSPLVASNLPPQ